MGPIVPVTNGLITFLGVIRKNYILHHILLYCINIDKIIIIVKLNVNYFRKVVMSKIKAGCIGAGYWGPNLIRNFLNNQDVEVNAVCDIDQTNLDKVKKKIPANSSINYTQDYKDLLSDKEIDCIVIATPIDTHFQIAKESLEHNKHVFIEKPLTLKSSDSETLIKLAEEKKKILMVGHVFLFNSVVRKIKEIIQKGELGDILYIYSMRENLGRIQKNNNVFWSMAPHDISIVNYWLDAEPTEISAHGFSFVNKSVEDVGYLSMKYPNNIGVHVHMNWLAPDKIRTMNIVGTKKMLKYDDVSPDYKIMILDRGFDKIAPGANIDSFEDFQVKVLLRQGDIYIPKISFSEPLAEEVRHFVDCVKSNKKPISDGYNGLSVVRILEAADQSIKEQGKIINI